MTARHAIAIAAALAAFSACAERHGKMDAKIALGRLALGDGVVEESRLYGTCAMVANAENDSVFYFDATGGRSRAPENSIVVDIPGGDAVSPANRVCALLDARTGGRLPLVARFAGRARPGPSVLMPKNALGICSMGDADEAELKANESWYIAHRGGDIEGLALARMAVETIRALPANIRRDANEDGTTWLTALTLMRRARKTAVDDESYMNGATHRPLIAAADIDEKRLLASAAAMGDCITPPPVFTMLDCPSVAMTPETGAYAFSVTGGAGKIVFRMKAAAVRYARTAWRVLADGGGTVELPNIDGVDDEIDAVMSGFAAAGRVDIGCFAVAGPGDISIPAICSVNFPAPPALIDAAISNLVQRGYLAKNAFAAGIAAEYRDRKIRGMKMARADLPDEIRSDAGEADFVPVAMCDLTGDGLGDLLMDCTPHGVLVYARIKNGGYRKIGAVERRHSCIVPKMDGSAALLAVSQLKGVLFAADLVEVNDGALSFERICEGTIDRTRLETIGLPSLFWTWRR